MLKLYIFSYFFYLSIAISGIFSDHSINMELKMKKAYFAAGCFWGVESIFQDLEGVVSTRVGYMNGYTKYPTYQSICNKDTGHAEAVEITYDSTVIDYHELCMYFWKLHDPTTLNRQGPDIGSQYRSGIFFSNDLERKIAEVSKKDAQNYWQNPIVTEIVPALIFYEAEEYHQNYFKNKGISHTGCHFLRSWD